MKESILAIIEKKKQFETLTAEEIKFAVDGFVSGEIPDYQMAALLMAVRLNGMSDGETFALADAMARSGEILDLSAIPGVTVDKHSTGGVSDSTTFIVAPILAELGFYVAKMSGRALGHTGGTIDKLETFPGFRADLSPAEFIACVQKNGLSVIAANLSLAPADKKIYALRDVTGTVDSLPLIAASVVSKKIASGAAVIVFDVKYGGGALMENFEAAKRLAELMCSISKKFGRTAGALVTAMHQPLGCRIGAGEVSEAVSVLHGALPGSDLERVSFALVGRIAELAGRPVTEEQLRGLLDRGGAYNRFCRMIASQGGTLPAAAPLGSHAALAKTDGIISAIDAKLLGGMVARAGGGRARLGDAVDHAVGIDLAVRLGDRVTAGQPVAYFEGDRLNAQEICDCFTVGEKAPMIPELIGDAL